jgi:hypothetical protein
MRGNVVVTSFLADVVSIDFGWESGRGSVEGLTLLEHWVMHDRNSHWYPLLLRPGHATHCSASSYSNAVETARKPGLKSMKSETLHIVNIWACLVWNDECKDDMQRQYSPLPSFSLCLSYTAGQSYKLRLKFISACRKFRLSPLAWRWRLRQLLLPAGESADSTRCHDDIFPFYSGRRDLLYSGATSVHTLHPQR